MYDIFEHTFINSFNTTEAAVFPIKHNYASCGFYLFLIRYNLKENVYNVITVAHIKVTTRLGQGTAKLGAVRYFLVQALLSRGFPFHQCFIVIRV